MYLYIKPHRFPHPRGCWDGTRNSALCPISLRYEFHLNLFEIREILKIQLRDFVVHELDSEPEDNEAEWLSSIISIST